MMSQPGKGKIAIHILPNISRSEGNQTMAFGQLTEYNLINIFLKKSYAKFGGETIPRPFPEKSKLSISLGQYSKVLYSLFLLYVKLKAIEIYQNYAADHFLLLNVKVWKWSSCLIFCMISEEKHFSCYILSTGQILLPVCLYFVRYWVMCLL